MESAIERHNRMVKEERLQAERVRTDGGGSADIWKHRAHQFRPKQDEHDLVIDLVADLAGPYGKVIDVGAGGGRIAIPLSYRISEVIAVEPSEAMQSVLQAEISHRGIRNIRIIPTSWENAEIDPAEVVLASHVTYGVQDIEPFLRKMDQKAARRAAVVVFTDPPQNALAPFWEYIYGEPRLRLPCRDELLDVLIELGVKPEIIELPPQPPQPIGNPDEAFAELRRRLFIGQGNPLEKRLRAAMQALTIERDGLIWIKDAQPNQRSLIHWQGGSMRATQTWI